MRVFEVAKEFGIPSDQAIQLLREMGEPVRSEAAPVGDAAVAKLRARFERHRRSGASDPVEVVEAVIEDAHVPTRRRRRRRPADEVEVDDTVEAEGGDEAEAAQEPEAAHEPEAAEPVMAEAPGAAEPAAASAGAEAPAEVEDAEVEDAEALEKAPAEEETPAEVAAEAETEAGDVAETVEAAAVEEAPAVKPAPPTPAGPRRAKVEAEATVEADAEVEAHDSADDAEGVVAAGEPEEAAAAEAEVKPAAEAEGEKREKPKRRPKRVSEGLPGIAPAASAGPGGKVRIQAEGYTPDGRAKRDKKKKRRQRVDQDAVQENLQRVMAELKGSGGGRKRRRSRHDPESKQEEAAERERRVKEEATTVRVNEFLTVAELAELVDETATEIIASAFKNLGMMVTINQRLDFDQIELLLDEFGYKAVREEEYEGGAEEDEEEERPEDLVSRPPVVTVMGHVDHGKTSLLDYIRKTNVIAGESGGITQHIGAYHVTLDDGRSLSFLDTPGHAAFTAMRARGADVTDVVILVVAADDAVMPQTVEAISHARNAGVPLVVAINKTDLPGADPARVKQELLEHQVVVEEFGGDVLSHPVSAKTGAGIDELLEKVLLQSEILDLKANPNREAHGVVIEAELDVGKGPVATVLVTSGTLRVGDDLVCGLHSGRVRALLDERGKSIEKAGPAMPAQVLGISGVPQAGDKLMAMAAVRAQEIVQTRQRLEREKKLRIRERGVKLTDISQLLAAGETAQLNVVLKGDVDGSVQALSDSLEQLSTNEVEVKVIHRGVGAINRSDALLAATSSAVIIGFHVRPDADARKVAEQEGVDIRLYDVIYEAIEDVRAALEGLLAPEEREVLLGAAEIRQLFKVPRAGTVAGCYVTEGVIRRNDPVRLVRDGTQIYRGHLGSLKRFKDDVKEVREGFECGMNIDGYNDIKVGDVIECFKIEEIARTLASTTGERSDDRS
jgi:translation initiation factor IF-2